MVSLQTVRSFILSVLRHSLRFIQSLLNTQERPHRRSNAALADKGVLSRSDAVRQTRERFVTLLSLEREMKEYIDEESELIKTNPRIYQLITEYANRVCPVYYHDQLSVALSDYNVAITETSPEVSSPIAGIESNIIEHLITVGIEYVQQKDVRNLFKPKPAGFLRQKSIK